MEKTCKQRTIEYMDAIANELHFDKLRKLREQYVTDILHMSPRATWEELTEAFFPAIFTDFEKNDIRWGREESIKETCLRICAREYRTGEIGKQDFNAMVELFGWNEEVFKDEFYLCPQKLAEAREDFNGVLSYYDYKMFRTLFLTEHIENMVDEIEKNYVFQGCQFVKDMRKFGEQFSVRYNNSERAVAEVCRNILNYNPNLPSNQRRFGKEHNIFKFGVMDVQNEKDKYIFINTRFFTTVPDEKSERGYQVVVDKVPMDVVKENLPEGMFAYNMLADKYALMIEPFEVTREMVEDKASACERIVALKDAEEAFAKR